MTDIERRLNKMAGRTSSIEDRLSALQNYGKKPSSEEEKVQGENILFTPAKDGFFEGLAILPSSPQQALKDMGYTAERLGAGLLGAVEGVTDLLGTGIGKAVQGITSVGGLFPNAVSEWGGDVAEHFLNTSPTQTWENSIRERYNPSAGAENLSGVGQTIAQMLPAIGVGSAISAGGSALNAAQAASRGANAGRAIMGAQAAGNAASEAYREGADTNQALAYGVTSGLLETTIESIAGGIPGLGRGKIGEISDALMANPIVSRALDIAGEGGEEALSTALTPYLQRAIYDPDAENATAEEIAQSAVLGAVAAGVLQGGLVLPTAISNTVSDVRNVRQAAGSSQDIVNRANQQIAQDLQARREAVNPLLSRFPSAEEVRIGQTGRDNRLVLPGNEQNNTAPERLHEVLAASESGTPLFQSESTSQGADVPLRNDMPLGEPEGSPTNNSILPDGQDVNIQAVSPDSSVGAARYGFDPYTNLQGKYGTLPEGEKPSRVVDVPARTSDKSKVSLTARTVMEAAVTPDSSLPDVAQLVVDGRLSYIPVSNNQRTVMAESKIKRVGYSDALANWRSDVRAGKSSADLVAMGAQLYNATVNAGDTKAAMDILYDYTRLIRSGAQATQAARILKTLTPAGTLYMIQKEVNNINEAQPSKKKKTVSSSDNVPVEIWMQRVGENLADELSRRIEAPKDQVQTVAQTILSDLRRYANETAPKRLQTGKTRTEMNRIMDLFQNKAAYNEAWAAAKDTLSDTFENDPDALAAFDDWLNQSLDYTKALTKELTKQSDIVISEDLADAYLNAETEDARAQALDAIYQSIADQVPSTWRDKWNAWRYLAMLANPRTHVRNFVGNIGFQPLRFAKDRVASVIEAGVSRAGGNIERTKSFASSPELYRAAWNDWPNVKDVLSGNKYDDVRSEINSRRRIFKTAPLEAARTGNSWLLEFEDSIFKRITYSDALAGYLQANGVTAEQVRNNTVDAQLMARARDYAGQEALKATYQDRNQFSDLMSRRARETGAVSKAANVALDAVLPFRRTPANILVRGFEYSPLGLAKSLTADLYKVKQGKISAAEAIDHIAAGLTGTGLFALGAYLFSEGIVTSGGGDDENQDALNELTGGQNYALNLPGGGNVTLDWLAPEALPFFMGVELMDSLGQDGSTAESIMSALSSISEPMLNLSMLQSLNDMIDSVSYADSSQKITGLVGSALISYFTQAIPTIGGQFERSVEENRMSTYTDKNLQLPTDIQYAIGRASARIPGWDYQQIPYIDAWGRREDSGPLWLRTANNFLNPAYTSNSEVTPVDEEIQRLYDETGESGIVPDRPQRYITVNGERMDLNAEQYTQYAEERGQMQFSMLESVFESPAYQAMNDTDKAALVEDVYSYADAVTKSNISDYEPDGWIANVVESGVDPADYILYKHSKQDGMTLKERSELMERSGISGADRAALLLTENPDWAEDAREYGLSEQLYVNFKIATSDVTSDKDENGKTVTNSKKEKIMYIIDQMGVDNDTKDALYYAAGYKESTIGDAPWH